MIPVFGVPILNKPDLLQRMFNTIDEPIGRLFIVDNGGVVPGNISRWPTDVQSYHVSDPGYNMGVAASWNHIIKANMNASYWVIANNDIKFSAGALHDLSEFMDNTSVATLLRIEIKNEGWGNHFGAFAINAEALDTVGWFDENLYPIYFEDTDWMRRAEKAGIAIELIRSKSFHDGNASWKDNPTLSKNNKKSWDGNVKYFDGKWGINRMYEDGPYEWAAGGNMRIWWPPKLSRLRAQAWDIEREDSGPK